MELLDRRILLVCARNGYIPFGIGVMGGAGSAYLESFWSYDFDWLRENVADIAILLYAVLLPLLPMRCGSAMSTFHTDGNLQTRQDGA